VFPELCLTGYDFEAVRALADQIPGELTDPLVEIAGSNGIVLIAGVPERDGDSLYNSAVLVDAAGVQTVYRKHNLWGPETDVFEPGSRRVTTETSQGSVGFMICHDLSFPEFALSYGGDCDVIVTSAAWEAEFTDDWRLLLRARAFDCDCYVVGSNVVGTQRSRWYDGHSLVVGPDGNVLANAGEEAGIVSVTTE